MNKERRLSRIARVLLAASFALTSCRESISTKQPPEPPPSVLPFETPLAEIPEVSTSTPEIEFIKDFENRMAPGEIIKEEKLVSYNNNLIRGFCGMMDCRGFYPKVAFKYLPEEMERIWQEEGIEPITYYRTGITNELARQAPDRVFGPDMGIVVPTPADYRPFFISRSKGFSVFGTLGEKEKTSALENFNEIVILWASGEFALKNDLTPVVLQKDKEKLRLIQETFEALKISFPQAWILYRESDIKNFLLLTGENLGGKTESEKLNRGFSLLYALDKADTETIENLLSPPLEA